MRDPADGPAQKRQRISVTESQGQELRACRGVFWPADVYKTIFGKPIPRRAVKILKGKKGVLRIKLNKSGT